jgi:hypothetical protein
MHYSTTGRIKPNPAIHSFVAVRGICITAVAVFIIASCNTNTTPSATAVYPNDLVSDNNKGPVTEITTDTYLIDSTGKPGAIDEKFTVKYDSAGFVTSVITTNSKDSVKATDTYTHNASGLLTEQVITDGNNKKKSSLVIEYDSTGKPTIAKSYDSTGKIDVYYTNIGLSKYGKFTGGTGYHPDSTLKLSFTNEFDSIHYIGGSSKDSTGKVTYSSSIQLDSNGNPQKMEETSVTMDSTTKKDVTKKTITTYTYGALDSHGNWTEQTEHIISDDKTKVPHLYKRVITYKE